MATVTTPLLKTSRSLNCRLLRQPPLPHQVRWRSCREPRSSIQSYTVHRDPQQHVRSDPGIRLLRREGRPLGSYPLQASTSVA
eukprot:4512758-Pyramimonas_sp.AAC.1